MNGYTCFRFTLISIAGVCLFATQALAQATAPASETRSESLPQPSTAPVEEQLESQTPSGDRPSCPAGQFASAFPDVTPNDWAYEAVNRLAIGPIQCFPINHQS